MIKFISALLVALMLSDEVVHKEHLDLQNCSSSLQRDPDIKDKVFISVEFSIQIEDFRRHTFFVNSFTAAVAEWAKHLPIRTTFYFDGILPVVGKMPLAEPDRLYVINVGFVDLQSGGYNYDKKIVGIWEPWRRNILFDVDYFQQNPTELYSVALHELGHLFGLPHIVNKFELGYTGYLVLQEGDARDYVMYPAAFDDREQNKLSDIEIEFARHQAKFIFSIDKLSSQTECQVAIDK